METGADAVPAGAPHQHGFANRHNCALTPRVMVLGRCWPLGSLGCCQTTVGAPESIGPRMPPVAATAEGLTSEPLEWEAPEMERWVFWRGSRQSGESPAIHTCSQQRSHNEAGPRAAPWACVWPLLHFWLPAERGLGGVKLPSPSRPAMPMRPMFTQLQARRASAKSPIGSPDERRSHWRAEKGPATAGGGGTTMSSLPILKSDCSLLSDKPT